MIDFKRALPYFVATTTADETGPSSAVENADAIVVRSWTADLAVAYVIEESDALCFVRWRDLVGLDVDDLHDVAVANLRERAATHLLFRADGPIVGVFLDGKLDASVLLLDEPWERHVANDLPAPIVAVAAARDVLALTSASSTEGIAELRAIADRGQLSRELLVRQQGGWQPYA